MRSASSVRTTHVPTVHMGTNGLKQTQARRVIKQTLDGITKYNDKRISERAGEREAARSEVKPIQSALERLLTQDAEAAAALTRLQRSKLDLKLTSKLKWTDLQRPSTPLPFLMQPLHEHINVYGPPYDYPWNWGNSDQHVEIPAKGQFGVVAQSAHTNAAAAGVGMLLTSDKPAMVFVRPYIQTTWEYAYTASGIASSASVRGGIDASTFLDGQMIAGVKRDEAFSDSGSWDDSAHEFGGGVAWIPNIELSFSMAAGKTYAVNFGAWVECDHSTGIGTAGAGGRMQGEMKFVVVERWVGG